MEVTAAQVTAFGIIVPVVVAVIGGAVTWATSKRSARNDQSKTQFEQNMALTKYIDERVDAATKNLRDELAEVKQLVGSLHGRLSRTREAIRAYIYQVRTLWGTAEQPPPLDGHLLELLGENEAIEDTYTAEQVRRITQDDGRPAG